MFARAFVKNALHRSQVLRRPAASWRHLSSRVVDEGLGGRERLSTSGLELSEEEVEKVEKIIHPDMGQNKLDKYAFAIEMTESTAAQKLSVRGMGDNGFFINQFFVEGSILLLDDVVLNIDAKTVEDLTIDHFALLEAVTPPIDLLVIGTGKFTTQLPEELTKSLRRIAPIEVCSSFNACTTFNLMNIEDRSVAAVILSIPEEQEE